MISLPETINNAVEQFSKLPGVGARTATRQTLHMTEWSSEELYQFGESIKQLAHLKKCSECGLFSDQDLCSICLDDLRTSNRTICVVENISDALAIERSGHYRGLIHILGGVLNPLIGIGPEQLRIEKLFERIKRLAIKEVILAINPSVEGDATCAYLKHYIPKESVVERIGFGIPIGGHLEYLDALTIGKALENRKEF